MNEPKLEIMYESAIGPALDQEIRHFLTDIFPEWEKIFREERAWHDAKPVYTALAFSEGRVVGHVAVVERTITTCWNWRYNVGSIQGVSVAPAFRKTGLSHRLLHAVLDEAVKNNWPFAVLFCRELLVPFYESFGWKLPDDSMIMWKDRELPIAMRSNCPMYWVLGSTAWPEGPIDVHNPFEVPIYKRQNSETD